MISYFVDIALIFPAAAPARLRKYIIPIHPPVSAEAALAGDKRRSSTGDAGRRVCRHSSRDPARPRRAPFGACPKWSLARSQIAAAHRRRRRVSKAPVFKHSLFDAPGTVLRCWERMALRNCSGNGRATAREVSTKCLVGLILKMWFG